MANNIMAHPKKHLKRDRIISNYVKNEIWHHPGKHQGKKLKNLPMDYLNWGLDNFKANGPQSTIIQMELSRRLGI